MSPDRKVRLFGIAATVVILGAGCAAPPQTVEIPTTAVANPPGGPTIAIVDVRDQRVFASGAYGPTYHYVSRRKSQDEELTFRTVARSHNALGEPGGEVLLPKGRTVASLIRETVTAALRRAGYRVLERDAPGWAEAAPLEVRIVRFWAWFTQGASFTFHGSVEVDAEISITGPLPPFENGETFAGRARLGTLTPTERAWVNVIAAGLDDLETNVRERIPNASG